MSNYFALRVTEIFIVSSLCLLVFLVFSKSYSFSNFPCCMLTRHSTFCPIHLIILLISFILNGSWLYFKSVFFRNFKQRKAIVLPKFRDIPSILSLSFIQFWTAWLLKMGPICCPETSVRNYHSTLRKTPWERTSHSHSGRSLSSRSEGQSAPTCFVTALATVSKGWAGQWQRENTDVTCTFLVTNTL
jgi:hypothetical protein